MIYCYCAKPYCSLCCSLLGPIESGYQIEWRQWNDHFECAFAHPIRDRPFKLMKRVMSSSKNPHLLSEETNSCRDQWWFRTATLMFSMSTTSLEVRGAS